MKSRFVVFTSLGLLAVLTFPPGRVVQAQGTKRAQYSVRDLGTLGGANSFAYAINHSGMVAGGANTPGQNDFIAQTAFFWYGGQPISLGTLAGPDCPTCSSEGSAVSANGTVAIISETATADPQGEDFCEFGTHRQCLAALWKNGTLTALPTLPGGKNAEAFFVNNQGEIVGVSETGTPDAGCATPFQVRRFEAVKWAPRGEAKVANLAAKIVLRLPASAGRGWLTPNGKTDPPGTYYIRFYEGSAMKQERVDGDFHEAELALLRKERLLKAHSQGFVLLKEKAPDGAAKAHRLTEIISAYIDQESKPDKNRDCRPAKSLRSVKSEFDLFYLAVKVTFVEELTRKHLEDWRDVLNLTYEPDTVYNKLMNATTVLKNNPLRPTPALLPVSEFPDKKETVPDPYTEDEFHTMLREATYDEGLLLYFFATSGMREQEVAHAEREDIDWSLGELHIVKKAKFGFTGKTRAALRQVPLTDELLGELHLKASGLLFPNEGTGRPEGHFLRIVERIATAAGVTPTTAKPHMIAAGMVKDDWCHRFRDTFLANEVHKAKNMADLMLLAKRVGHKDLKTLDKYFGKLKKPYESRLRIKRSTSVISIAS